MTNKRTRQGVPATEAGAVAGDGSGSRPFMQMPTKGGRNATTNESRRGARQIAPRPQTSKSQYMSASAHTAPTQAGMARVKNAGMGDVGRRLPVQSPTANIVGQQIGQPNPNTAAASTAKPKRKGLGAAFYGEL